MKSTSISATPFLNRAKQREEDKGNTVFGEATDNGVDHTVEKSTDCELGQSEKRWLEIGEKIGAWLGQIKTKLSR